jgi:hypothetical protein
MVMKVIVSVAVVEDEDDEKLFAVTTKLPSWY